MHRRHGIFSGFELLDFIDVSAIFRPPRLRAVTMCTRVKTATYVSRFNAAVTVEPRRTAQV